MFSLFWMNFKWNPYLVVTCILSSWNAFKRPSHPKQKLGHYVCPHVTIIIIEEPIFHVLKKLSVDQKPKVCSIQNILTCNINIKDFKDLWSWHHSYIMQQHCWREIIKTHLLILLNTVTWMSVTDVDDQFAFWKCHNTVNLQRT